MSNMESVHSPEESNSKLRTVSQNEDGWSFANIVMVLLQNYGAFTVILLSGLDTASRKFTTSGSTRQ